MKLQLETSELVIFESALFRTTSTLLIRNNYLLLVDPNWLPHEIDFIKNYIDKIKANRQCFLLFTHSDYDHIIGYGKFKEYTTIASQNFIDNPLKNKCLAQIVKFDDEYYIQRDYAIEYPQIDVPISGNDTSVKIGADSYIFDQAMGHNFDGMLTFNRSQGVLIVGDYLSNIEFPYIYESVKKYEFVLDIIEEKISSEEIKILITGHGDYTFEKDEMLQRVEESRSYIQQLKDTVNGAKFDLQQLFKRYKFPQIMNKFHAGNVKVAAKEVG